MKTTLTLVGLIAACGHTHATTSHEPSPGHESFDEDSARAEIQDVARANQAAVRFCYEQELVRGETPMPHGRMAVRFVIGMDGSVGDATITEVTPELDIESMKSCVLGNVTTWRFAPRPAPVEVDYYPFVFATTDSSDPVAP